MWDLARLTVGLTMRQGSEVWWYEGAVPSDVVDRLKGRRCSFTFPDEPTVRVDAKFGSKLRTSLRTEVRDVAEVGVRDLEAHLARLYQQARVMTATALNNPQRVALSGAI